MSVRERHTVCRILTCDGCGDDYDGSGDYQPHYNSAEDAREEAHDNSEWRNDGEHDWCESCQTKPHDCTQDPKDRDSCARCCGPLD